MPDAVRELKCGIQSYWFNCNQKEQGGSSSLHVHTGSCTLQQLWRPFVQRHIFYVFFRAR